MHNGHSGNFCQFQIQPERKQRHKTNLNHQPKLFHGKEQNSAVTKLQVIISFLIFTLHFKCEFFLQITYYIIN